jgi:hypothetical protein
MMSWFEMMQVNDVADLRTWLLLHTPEFLHPLVPAAQDGLSYIATAVIAAAAVGAAVSFAMNVARGVTWLAKLLSRPRDAVRDVVEPPVIAPRGRRDDRPAFIVSPVPRSRLGLVCEAAVGRVA